MTKLRLTPAMQTALADIARNPLLKGTDVRAITVLALERHGLVTVDRNREPFHWYLTEAGASYSPHPAGQDQCHDH